MLFMFTLTKHIIVTAFISYLQGAQGVVCRFLILITTTCGTLTTIPNNNDRINNCTYCLTGVCNMSDKDIIMIT